MINYHVSPSGSDNYSGSFDAPFSSLQRATDLVDPGDTVTVHTGTYTCPPGRNRVCEIKRSGTETLPIIFRDAGDGPVILDGKGQADWVLYVNGEISPVSNVRIFGMQAIRGKTGGVYVRNSSMIRLEACISTDCQGSSPNTPGIGVFISKGGSNILVSHCETARNGIGIKVGDITTSPQPSAVTLEKCWSHHNVYPAYPNNSDGIQMLGVGNLNSVIRGCVVSDNGDDGMDIGNGAMGVLVEHCVVYNHLGPGDGSGIKIGTHENYITPDGGHIIRKNYIVGCKLRCLDIAGNYRYPSEIGKRPPPCLLYNNTCLRAGRDTVYVEMADVVAFNNIFGTPDDSTFWSFRLRANDNMTDDPPRVVSDYNLMGHRWIKDWNGEERTDQDIHSIQATPQFIGEFKVHTDLQSSTKFGRVSGLKLKEGSPGSADGCDVPRELAALFSKNPPEKWKSVLEPFAKRQKTFTMGVKSKY